MRLKIETNSKEKPHHGPGTTQRPPEGTQKGPGGETSAPKIRQFCLECVGGIAQEVATCTGVKCPLWEMRFGNHVTTQRKRDPDSLDRQKVLARHREGK